MEVKKTQEKEWVQVAMWVNAHANQPGVTICKAHMLHSTKKYPIFHEDPFYQLKKGKLKRSFILTTREYYVLSGEGKENTENLPLHKKKKTSIIQSISQDSLMSLIVLRGL